MRKEKQTHKITKKLIYKVQFCFFVWFFWGDCHWIITDTEGKECISFTALRKKLDFSLVVFPFRLHSLLPEGRRANRPLAGHNARGSTPAHPDVHVLHGGEAAVCDLLHHLDHPLQGLPACGAAVPVPAWSTGCEDALHHTPVKNRTVVLRPTCLRFLRKYRLWRALFLT